MVWSCLLEVPLLRKWLMTLTGSLVSVVFNHLFLQSVVCVHWWSGEREQPGTCSMSYPYTLQSLWTGCDCLMFIFLHSFMQFCQFSVLVRMYLCRNTKVVHSIINKKKPPASIVETDTTIWRSDLHKIQSHLPFLFQKFKFIIICFVQLLIQVQ